MTTLPGRVALRVAGTLGSACLLLVAHGCSRTSQSSPRAPASPAPGAEVAALQAQVDRLKGMTPSQSHAMADVGYHFANLWFAADRKNWPLAKFCLDETRSHLRWAVRIIPVRKGPGGEDVDLKGILDAVDSGVLTDVQKAIDARDSVAFSTAYRQAIESCYSCHKASGKPYLRPRIPLTPAAPILNFDPDAKWPQ